MIKVILKLIVHAIETFIINKGKCAIVITNISANTGRMYGNKNT